ncbi:putative baseplate assembly protein [Paraburkholderia steynii]|uniref:Baseplate assembly protein n=1 Tax=Paraburkholderia steynii TaxID=1245441 RepID=A0A7Z7FM55_9BURK|nr:putative baseplate assembly protein [Paraburkholderia steynii]SDJ22080.1 putative baseplate assembly protein [Paraburkholderia steynii]
MKQLAPNLFNLRFDDLMEMGRARLPELAPEWTDHNAHDPGITLMELLAWVTEAQLYSLGHMRRDERAAYAAIFGLTAIGTQPARGLIWPDWADPSAPVAGFSHTRVIDAGAVVNLLDSGEPRFYADGKFLWIPGRVRRLEARGRDGRKLDLTVANRRGGPAFQPFGTAAADGDVLLLEFECNSDDGILPADRKDVSGALWPLGVRADVPLTGASSNPAAPFDAALGTQCGSSLLATLVMASERFPLRIASDATCGLLRTGALLLDLSPLTQVPKIFSLELRPAPGFERPPRILRIEPNVLPVVQGRRIVDELHVITGVPDGSFQLDVPGLSFGPGAAPVKIELRDPNSGHRDEWRPGSLVASGPGDTVYELDTAAERVTFGNGVNGRIPPAGAQVVATYTVCDGERGIVAPNRKWQLQGFLGAFGVNLDAMVGGAAATGWIDERREARRRARFDHALVSEEDIVEAALALPLLEVARAWIPAQDDRAPGTGSVTLVAMRARRSEEDAGGVPESRGWLDAIRRRLATRMPLGTRLVVIGPRYVQFAIEATVEPVAGRHPDTVRDDIVQALRTRFMLIGDKPRQPGVPVTRRDVTAFIRRVAGVRRVTALRLTAESGAATEEIKVARSGLPRFDLAGSRIEVVRAAAKVAP